MSVVSVSGTRKIRLPKLEIRNFDGNPLEFRGFGDIFDSSVNKDNELSEIAKFTYLRSLLQGPALDLISGLSLTATNYKKALEFLEDRFGNKQTLISTYLYVLATLPTVDDINDISSLRNFFDKLETSVRNLSDLGKPTDSYGSLLVSIIFNPIPEELQIIISRHFKGSDWFVQRRASSKRTVRSHFAQIGY